VRNRWQKKGEGGGCDSEWGGARERGGCGWGGIGGNGGVKGWEGEVEGADRGRGDRRRSKR